MITGRQVRAARALLNWKQEMLAEKALVALTALKRLESERGLPVHEGTRDQVRRALEAAGILFVESDRGRGIMLLNEAPTSSARTRVPRPNLNAATLAGHEYRTISMDSPTMHSPPLDPPVADAAPTDGILTGYDEQHLVTYLRLLDADEGRRRLAGGREAGPAHRPRPRTGPRAARVGYPLGARPLDDGERLPPPPARRRPPLSLGSLPNRQRPLPVVRVAIPPLAIESSI